MSQRKMISFQEFKRFLQSRSQRLSQVLSPRGSHHHHQHFVQDCNEVGIEMRATSREQSAEDADIESQSQQVMPLGSPPAKKIHGRDRNAATVPSKPPLPPPKKQDMDL